MRTTYSWLPLVGAKKIFATLPVEVVHKYAEAHPRMFLSLFRQLAYGRLERRHELATKLYNSVLIGCQQAGSERDDILRAFAKVDHDLGMKLARDLGIDFPRLCCKNHY